MYQFQIKLRKWKQNSCYIGVWIFYNQHIQNLSYYLGSSRCHQNSVPFKEKWFGEVFKKNKKENKSKFEICECQKERGGKFFKKRLLQLQPAVVIVVS